MAQKQQTNVAKCIISNWKILEAICSHQSLDIFGLQETLPNANRG